MKLQTILLPHNGVMIIQRVPWRENEDEKLNVALSKVGNFAVFILKFKFKYTLFRAFKFLES